MMNRTLNLLHRKLLSEKTKEKSEKVILTISIISFVIHLGLIYLINLDIITWDSDSNLLSNPIAAIYTPFSFILLYEVYLLIYYLPKSITTYISKQYEIITLIIIRRLFKDLSNLELSSEWFQIKDDLQFTYDLLASIVLFYLLYLFHSQSKKAATNKNEELSGSIQRFIEFKKAIATLLVPVLLGLAIYTFAAWFMGTINPGFEAEISFKNSNNIFFDEFFTILIITDVILLLLSFYHTDRFHKVIRNSGFIISTILIRLSFSVEGLINTVLIIVAIVFGLAILAIHNKYQKSEET